MKLNPKLLQIAGALVLLTACSTPPKNQPGNQGAGTGSQKLEIDGLTLCVSPLTIPADVKRTFPVNLLAEGVIPIKVVVENNNASSTFIITKDKVVIRAETSEGTNSTQHGESSEDLSRVSRKQQVLVKESAPLLFLNPTVAPLITASIVLMIEISPIDSRLIDRRKEYKLASKEFYTRALRPGQRAEGYIFYRIPKQSQHAGACHVVAQVENSTKQESVTFDLPIDLNLDRP